MKLKQQLISNTVFSVIGLIFSRLIGIVLTPYVLYKLGVDLFAVWAIMGAILGYLSKADMGLATSYVKFISQYYAKKDYDSINKVINSGFVYYVCISAVMLVIVFFGKDYFFEFFKLEEAMRTEARTLFQYVVIITVCSACLKIFNEVLYGVQRLDIIKKVQTGLFAVEALCKVIFLELGFKLSAMVWTQAITTILRIGICIALAYKLVPQLRFNPFLFDLKMFRKMFGYGIQLQLSRLAKMGQMNLGTLILAHFLPPSAVAIYVLGNRGALSVRSFPLALLPSMIPAASQLHSADDFQALKRLYRRASKYMSILIMHLFGFLMAMVPVVILSWLGEQVDVFQVSLVIRILLVGFAYSLLVNIASYIVLGMGHPEYFFRFSIITLVTNVSLLLVLIPPYGFMGAALATAAADIIGSFYLAIVCHRELKESYWQVIKTLYLWPMASGTVAFCLTFVTYKLICLFAFVPQGRLQNIGVLIFSGLVYSMIYAVVLLPGRYIDQYDRDLFWQYFRKDV